MEYPVRCMIVSGENVELRPGLYASTPEVSKPHLGKSGWARKNADGEVTVTLDDGTVLSGRECWWTTTPSDQVKIMDGLLERLSSLVFNPPYFAPHISTAPDGGLTAEWWFDNKKRVLICFVEVDGDQIEYLTVGIDGNSAWDVGVNPSDEKLKQLWSNTEQEIARLP